MEQLSSHTTSKSAVWKIMSWRVNLTRGHDGGWLQPQPKKSSKLSQAPLPSQSPSPNISLRPSERPIKKPEQVPRSNPKQPPEPPPLHLQQAAHYEQDSDDLDLEEKELGLSDKEKSSGSGAGRRCYPSSTASRTFE